MEIAQAQLYIIKNNMQKSEKWSYATESEFCRASSPRQMDKFPQTDGQMAMVSLVYPHNFLKQTGLKLITANAL